MRHMIAIKACSRRSNGDPDLRGVVGLVRVGPFDDGESAKSYLDELGFRYSEYRSCMMRETDSSNPDRLDYQMSRIGTQHLIYFAEYEWLFDPKEYKP